MALPVGPSRVNGGSNQHLGTTGFQHRQQGRGRAEDIDDHHDASGEGPGLLGQERDVQLDQR